MNKIFKLNDIYLDLDKISYIRVPYLDFYSKNIYINMQIIIDGYKQTFSDKISEIEMKDKKFLFWNIDKEYITNLSYYKKKTKYIEYYDLYMKLIKTWLKYKGEYDNN